MKRHPRPAPDRTVLAIVLILLVSPMTLTPPAPVVIHAAQVIVHPAPEEARPAMALALDGWTGAHAGREDVEETRPG